MYLVFLELPLTFEFMTAAAFEARLCPTLLNEIKKTKPHTYTSTRSWHKLFVASSANFYFPRPPALINE
jgi:hypothetical protein